MAYIYKISNIKNGKFYIGSTKDFNRRKNEHIKQLSNDSHHNRSLQNDWDKYKKASFKFEILEEVPDEDQFKVEQIYLDDLVNHLDEIYNKNKYCDGRNQEYFKQIRRECKVCGTLFTTDKWNEYACSPICKDIYFEYVRMEARCETWKLSKYEYKDISDWDVDDHMAANYDDRMSK